MARLNVLTLRGVFGSALKTHEGGAARALTPELALRRSVLACLLWETQFYEDGVEIGGRIQELVPNVEADHVAALAVEARESLKLRHAPLLLVREMARHKTHRALVAGTLARVILRADEIAEFVAIYWKDGKTPLSAQVKKGLAAAFGKFDEYQLAKYDRAQPVRLRDVLFLCHAKPRDEAQAALWKRLAEGQLREVAESVSVYSFSDRLVPVPARRGFALRDAIDASQPHNATYLGVALKQIEESYDRLIVITDEQAHDNVASPRGRGIMINVASYKNGVGYGEWTHIDGWSEAVVDYVRELEGLSAH
jgi:hypothetical protein